MPSLLNYDPLATMPATKTDVEIARELAEDIITVNGKTIQFGDQSRRRMKDVMAMESESDVTWFDQDNVGFTVTKSEFRDLVTSAEMMMGQRTLDVFAISRAFKDRIDSGEQVMKSELRQNMWVLA